ncbi:MAG: hypothetical protein O3C54_05985 [Proteobacteria bacterium]|nr:hypothetical protein [Pseudomonadota bacterium]
MKNLFKIFFILFFFLQNLFASANDDFKENIEKAFEKFSIEIEKNLNKSEKLPKPKTKESEIIDKAINEIDEATKFVSEIYKSGDYVNTENTIEFLLRSISDIEKLVPQEISSDMSEIDVKSMKPEDIKKIKLVTDGMKKSKNQMLEEFVEKLDSLSEKGLNVYSISYNLNNLGVSTINFSEIANVINSNPTLRQKTLNSIEQDLKKAGFSPKDIQQAKDDINQASLPKSGTKNSGDDSRVKELKELLEKAKGDRENAEKAREQRDAAVKAAEEAQEAAKKAQETANSIADQTSKAAKEAAEKAQEAAKEAQEAVQKASQASRDYEFMKGWLESTENSIKELQKIQGVNENYNSLDNIYNNSIAAKNINNISQKDFVKLDGLTARLVQYDNPFGPKPAVIDEEQEYVFALSSYVSKLATDSGLSKEEAGVLASNAATRYLDMKFLQNSSYGKFRAQGLSDEIAKAKSIELVQDKYGDWYNNIGIDKIEGLSGFDVTNIAKDLNNNNAVSFWVTSVAMAKKAAKDFGTLDPNDEAELNLAAQATAEKVLKEALNQGFSKEEAEQIAKNTYETMFSGLKFAYQTGEALLQKGLTEEEMEQVLSKMIKDRFGTADADFFNPGNLGDIGDEKAIKFYVTGLGALKYAMENREKSINPDDVNEVEKVISDTEKLVRERAAKLGITDQSKIDKFALDAKNSVIDLYHFGYAIEDYLGGPENTGPCDQDCIDENIDFILDKFYSKWGSRLFDVTSDNLKLDVTKIDVYVTGLVVTESAEAAKLAKENAEKAVKQAETTLNKAKELEQKAKDAQARADQIKDKSSKEYQDAIAKAQSAKKAAEAARDAAENAKNASEEAKKAYEIAEKELARLEKELKDLLDEIDIGNLGPGGDGAWDPRKTIAQNKDRKMEMSEIKSNTGLSNVMNSMNDKQVYGLLASGVINSDLVNEYIKNGANAPILACGTSNCEVGDLEYVFEEADRQMKISSITSNELLSKVLNSLTDRQAYELIASGAIPSDLVNEYIKNGANAPILPCGSPGCSMIEYMDPNFTKGIAAGVDVVGLGQVQGVATDIWAATRDNNIKSAADALGDDLQSAIAEIQSTLDSGAVLRGVDGQEISVQEALESMPEGGTINADGTLTPVQPGQEEGATGCQGPCPEPDEDGDGNPG